MSGPAPPVPLASLSEDTLLRIFQLVGQVEVDGCPRHDTPGVFCALPLVCRSWRQLLLSPLLLRQVNIWLRERSLPHLRSLCEWLVLRAAGHVHRLELTLSSTGLPVAQHGEWHQLIAAALASCGAAGSLHHLALSVYGPCAIQLTSATVVALRSLKSLELCSSEAPLSQLPALLSALSDLEHLDMAVRLTTLPTLPPSLSFLRLSHSTLPPAQMGHLSRLRSLQLEGSFQPQRYAALPEAPALEQLWLVGARTLPACLLHMTGLKELRLQHMESVVPLGEVLAALTGLTCLCIEYNDDMGPFPDSLAGLSRLQGLCVRSSTGLEDAQLPPGSWASNLQWAVLQPDVAACSLPALSAATQLERLALCFYEWSHVDHDEVAEVVEWAGRHPSLRLLRIATHEGGLGGGVSYEVLRATAAALCSDRRLVIDFDDSMAYDDDCLRVLF